MTPVMKIYLIGMPGSGKSTLGNKLALHLGVRYIDLDKEIEAEMGMSIPEIFKSHGENKFRVIESEILRKLSHNIPAFVMSTGGGAPCYHKGIHYMNQIGLTVYLNVSIDELERRLKISKEERPLLPDKQSIRGSVENLLFSRSNDYMKSKVIIESDSISVRDIESAIGQ